MRVVICGPVREEEKDEDDVRGEQVFVPGDVVSAESGLMPGYGTVMGSQGIQSTVLGRVVKVNKLLCVVPLKPARYKGEVGDVVVGTVVDVQQKRYVVDVGSSLHAVLLLSAVNLPGGVLRRRTELDALQMREHLNEGDVVVCEVQQSGSTLHLHTRSQRYGRLDRGVLLNAAHGCVRAASAFLRVDGVLVVLGANGKVWVGEERKREEGEQEEQELLQEEPEEEGPVLTPQQKRLRAATLANLIQLCGWAECPVSASLLLRLLDVVAGGT